MSNLEQSFRDICKAHDLTSFEVGVRNLGPDYGGHEWIAGAHWVGFTNTGHTCTSGFGHTLAESVAACLRSVAKDREPTTAIGIADEAIQIGEVGSMTAEVCHVCDGGMWVCENHADRPWGGTSSRDDACECGAGMPCGACNLRMASDGYSEPWRELACRAIDYVASAVRETSWGQPTFGPSADEELQAEYQALLTKQVPA